MIKIGASDFHFKKINKTFINGEKTELTFRENKLLHFHFQYTQNMVLEREKILSDVWEDEGVIVGLEALMYSFPKARKSLEC
ncbi:MAG: hypothetical protein R2788_15070 [Saprospiraceae bacterium]